MSAKHLVLILAVAATAVTAVYATQRHAYDDALPAAADAAVPQIVIVGKREHGAE